MRLLRTRRRRVVAAVVALAIVAFCVLTAVLFVYPDLNAPERSDAVVVLGGHGRVGIDAGATLAEQGYAPVLVLSLPKHVPCLPSKVPVSHVQLLCFVAVPASTQGEARSIAALARTHHWHRIIVVMPTPQASRARLRLGRCWPGQVLEVGYSPGGFGQWVQQFAYQWASLVKALVWQYSC